MYMTKERKKIPSLNYNYPIPLWFPFDTSNVWGFGFAFGYFLVLITLITIAFLVVVYVPTIVLFFMEMYAQLGILNHSIINLDKRAALLFNSSNNIFAKSSSRMAMDISSLIENKDYQRCLLYCLKQNVQHHWAIKRFRDTFQHLIGIFLGDVLVGSGLMIVTLSLTLAKSDTAFSPDNVKLLFLLGCELLNLFGYCLCGTLVKDRSLSVQTALFHCSWLQLSQSSKKSLQIFQVCSTRPLVFKGAGTFEINLECYLQVLNTTYSTFNVLNSINS
ncbi:hypothetical protein LSTR_LSTR012720 [Laodelphax striatellus]|uniref:Odorant receptor n=1 Tax=Laodelphax striatellus TaxID=195883 RepID=A0A482WMD5_LAOST|nr:hypothetical protein LSTR_LSTR012720 [Laodelphax striatellus]